MSYMTAGRLRAFEALMAEIPGFNHYDSGCDGNYQSCVFEECPYSPVKLSTLRITQEAAKEG